MVKKLLQIIWKNRWEPADLLRTVTSSEYVKYDEPLDLGCFWGKDYGFVYETKERTALGKWLDDLPAIIALPLLLIGNIVIFPTWMTCIIGVEFLKLFTKRWKNI